MKSSILPTAGLVVIVALIGGCGSDVVPEVSWAAMTGASGAPSADRTGAAAATASVSDAPPQLTDQPSLAEYLTYAALRNPGLKAAFYRWRAALQRTAQVTALPDPRLTYRNFIREVETRVGPQRQAVGLAQTFPWFGKLRLRGDVATAEADIARQRYQAVKLKLFYQVRDAYSEYYYLGRAVAITDENKRLLQHIESVARTRYKAAVGRHSDVIRAQVELGKVDDRLRTLRDLRGAVVARLNAALNRPPQAPLPWPKKLEQEKIKTSDEELSVLMVHSNPELKALDYEIDKQKFRLALARKDYYPDVRVGVDYIDTAKASGGLNPRDNGKDPVVAMISINLPIWMDKLRAGVREASHRRSAAVRLKTQKTNVLDSQLKMIAYRFRDAERKVGLYRDTLVPKAKESLKVTEASFRDGKGTFIDLIDAQRVLLAFELSYERALADQSQRLAELEMHVGTDIPRAVAERGTP